MCSVSTRFTVGIGRRQRESNSIGEVHGGKRPYGCWRVGKEWSLLLPAVELATRTPLNDEKVAGKVLVGGVLWLIPVVNLVCLGFLAEVMRRTARGNPGLPEWQDWADMLWDGLFVLLITLCYLGPPVAVSVVVRDLPLAFIMTILMTLAVALLVPMAVVRYVVTDRLTAALSLREVLRDIRAASPVYSVGCIMALGLYVVVGLFGLVPYVGVFIWAIGGFYASIVLAVLFGEIYRLRARKGKG